MKKYLLILSSILFLLVFVLSQKITSLAQVVSFEVYNKTCGAPGSHINCTPYPLVESPVVSPGESFVTIKAYIYDVSGVYSAVAKVRGPDFSTNGGKYMNELYPGCGNGAMDPVGGNIYEAVFDISDDPACEAVWDVNYNYTVDVAATDNLNNKSWYPTPPRAYENFTNFTLGSLSGTSINFTVPASASAGSTLNLSATLLGYGGVPITNKTIIFTDITGTPVTIGSSTTNSLGVTTPTISYSIPILAAGTKTLKAEFVVSGLLSGSSAQGGITIGSFPVLDGVLWPGHPESAGVYDAYNIRYKEARNQYLVYSWELSDAGLRACDVIAGIKLKTANVPINGDLQGFRIQMKQTAASVTTGWDGFGQSNTYFGATTVLRSYLAPASSDKSYDFSSSGGLLWDGTSNIEINITHQGPGWAGSDGAMYSKTFEGGQYAFSGYTDTAIEANKIYNATTGAVNGSNSNWRPSTILKYVRVPIDGEATQITMTSPVANAVVAQGGTIPISIILETVVGVPIVGARVNVMIDGVAYPSMTTIAGGIASTTYTGSTLGSHAISLEYFGNCSGATKYMGSTQSGSINVVASTVTELWTGNEQVKGAYIIGSYRDVYSTNPIDSRTQFIIRATDLANSLNSGDKILGIGLKSAETPGFILSNFQVNMKLIPVGQTTTSSWEAGWVSGYGPTGVPETSLAHDTWNNYSFSSGIVWDGTSNVMVNIVKDNFNGYAGGKMYWRSNIGSGRTFLNSLANGAVYTTGGTNGFSYTSSPFVRIISSGSSNISAVATQIVVAQPAPVTQGAIANISATLKTAGGVPIVGETVIFKDGTTDVGGATSTAGGVVSFNYYTSIWDAIGPHTITADYGGNASKGLLSSPQQTVALNFTDASGSFQVWAKDWNGVARTEVTTPPALTQHVYNTTNTDSRNQFIVLASELANLGLKYGDKVTGIQLHAYTRPGEDFNYLRIRMKQTTSTATTGWDSFSDPDYYNSKLLSLPASSITPGEWQTYSFDSTDGLAWDGTSNIEIDLGRTNSPTSTTAGGLYWRPGVCDGRSFAGTFNGTVDTWSALYNAGGGDTANGVGTTSCPSLKINYVRVPLYSGTATQTTISTVASAEAGTVISLTGTLKTSGNSPIGSEAVYFRDTTMDADIYSWWTNDTGTAVRDYTVASSGAAQEVHTIKFIYSGNSAIPYLSSEATTTLNVYASAVPVVTSFSAPAYYNSLTVPINTFTATDNFAVAKYMITETSTPPGPYGGSWTAFVPTSYTSLTTGSKILYPWAEDAAYNVSAVGPTASVIIDQTAPSGGSVSYINGYFVTTSVPVTYAKGTDGGSGLNNSTGKIQRQSATLSAGVCGTYGAFTDLHYGYADSPYSDTTVLSGNCYKYQYLISDNAGNSSLPYTSTSVAKVDTAAPNVSAGSDQSSTTTINRTATASDSVSGINATTYKWSKILGGTGAGTITFSASTALTTNITASSAGTYVIQFVAKDNAGNTGTSTFIFTKQ